MSTKKLNEALAILDSCLEHPNASPDERATCRAAIAELEAIERACRVLDVEDISGGVYVVRDRAAEDKALTGNTWEHPRVVAYGEAAQVITNIAKETRHD